MKLPPVDFSPPCPRQAGTPPAPEWTCSGMITFSISAGRSSFQLNTAFFFFNHKKEKNDIYCVCGKMEL